MVLWQADHQGMTATTLDSKVESLIGVAQSTTSRTVRILTTAGLVESTLCLQDRRTRLIRLTRVGRALLRSLAKTGG